MVRQSTLTFLPVHSECPNQEASFTADKATSAAGRSRDGASASDRELAPRSVASLQTCTESPSSSQPNHSNMSVSFDVPDSTDWKTTALPAFEALEAALRCQVCKEFFDNAVITTCSHTFCSLCVRRAITADGKCPACRTGVQADKLMANWAIREVVDRFQEARPKAMELATQTDKEAKEIDRRKRKLDETDLEDGEPARLTRSRTTRRRSHRGDGGDYAPIEVPDSEDDGEDEYRPEGEVNCPICDRRMKIELVDPHIQRGCPGEEEESGGRKTRSRAPNSFPKAMQQLDSSPAPTRLPQLAYSVMKEHALRQKLQQLGIPHTGPKALLVRRHTEWLNLWNANCDTTDSKRRKTKRQLLNELKTWEDTQGGNATNKEAAIMRKDYDGQAHARTHKDDFDRLIQKAREERRQKGTGDEKVVAQNNEAASAPTLNGNEHESKPAAQEAQGADHGDQPGLDLHSLDDIPRPYEGDQHAIATIRAKVEQANNSAASPSLGEGEPSLSNGSTHAASSVAPGMSNPFSSPSRKLPMFQVPEEPVVDVESSTTVQ